MNKLVFIQFAKKYTPKPVKKFVKFLFSCITWDEWLVQSWSQQGEDQVLQGIFKKKSGFYVDVGAHHPKRFSNTFLFYKRGWRGINIDAMPDSMRAFNKVRPRDINLEIGVGEERGKIDYYVFNEPALNGFSQDLSQQRHNSNSNYTIKRIIKVNVMPLKEVLDNYLPDGQIIDFMTIDVEGYDYQVLKSNDWSKYRPTFVLVEMIGIDCSLLKLHQSEIGEFMVGVGYCIFGKSYNTVFFKKSSS